MVRALILGGTGKQSLGREIALAMLADGITPILVGRTAEEVRYDPALKGCEFLTADLMDLEVAELILKASGDLSEIAYLVVAGGGPHLRGNLVSHTLAERRRLWRTVVEGPTEVVTAFHTATRLPYQLITIASTSAMMIRKDETVYGSAQAARRQFALNFNHELAQRPGSKNLVVCPGGMRTGLWAGKDVDTNKFMDPSAVAKIIWQAAQDQADSLFEFIIRRDSDGSPKSEEEGCEFRMRMIFDILCERIRQALRDLSLDSRVFSSFYSAFCFRRSISTTNEGMPSLSEQRRLVYALDRVFNSWWGHLDSEQASNFARYTQSTTPVPESFKTEVISALDHIPHYVLLSFARTVAGRSPTMSLKIVLENCLLAYAGGSRNATDGNPW